MSAEQFTDDPSRLPQNVTGWIEVTDEVATSFQFANGSVWLMAVPVYDRRDLKSWDYELHAVTIDCGGPSADVTGDGAAPLRLECNEKTWVWELADVAYMAPLRK